MSLSGVTHENKTHSHYAGGQIRLLANDARLLLASPSIGVGKGMVGGWLGGGGAWRVQGNGGGSQGGLLTLHICHALCLYGGLSSYVD